MIQQKRTVTFNYQPIVIGIVAGEVSGDALGASFMQQMNNLRDDIIWVGVGGKQMQAQGLQSIIEMSRLSVMGLVEVIKHLPDLLSAKQEILQIFYQKRINIFIGIDAPDFNLRLGKVLKNQGVFCVQYVSPSIWAWREGRIENIKQSTHLVLCLFPFELPVYQKHRHPAVCVGHSLLHTIDKSLLIKDTQQQRRELIWHNPILHKYFKKYFGDSKNNISHIVAVMPGSRRSEVSAILPIMLSTIQKLLIIDKELCFIIPAVNHNLRVIIEQYLDNQPLEMQERIIVSCDEKQLNFSQQVMKASDVVLLASGTATLEAMLLTRPMVVIYQLKPLSYWLAKQLIKIPYVSLPNILAGKQIVPELIQENANADNICRAIQQLLNPIGYEQQVKALEITSQQLREQSNAMPATTVIDGWLKWQSYIKYDKII